MVAVPADTPVTSPVEVLIVATPVAPLVQLPPETEDVKVVVPATQMVWVPLRVPAVGGVVTVMVEAAETVEQVGALKTTTV
jgi:hypothetical protein